MDSSAPVPGRRLAYVHPCLDGLTQEQNLHRLSEGKVLAPIDMECMILVRECLKSLWKTRNTNTYHVVRKYKDCFLIYIQTKRSLHIWT